MQKIVLKNTEWLQIDLVIILRFGDLIIILDWNLAQSIYSIALDKKPTGHTKFFNAEVMFSC